MNTTLDFLGSSCSCAAVAKNRKVLASPASAAKKSGFGFLMVVDTARSWEKYQRMSRREFVMAACNTPPAVER